MSEDEKKLVEKFKNLYIKDFNGEPITVDDRLSYIECALITNLIEKLDEELNNLKEIEKSHQEENGLLRQELDMQIEHNKELEATLKQTQDSWFEDTQKLEQEKEKTPESVRKQFETYQNRICELEEKNKELERYKKYYENEKVIWNRNDYIIKDKIKELLENEIIDISGFRCIALEDIENLLEMN